MAEQKSSQQAAHTSPDQASEKEPQQLPQPLRAAVSVLGKVPGAGTVGRVAGGALDRVGAVSPRGRRYAVYAGAGVLGVAGIVEWPIAVTGAAVAWLTQPRPGEGDASAGPSGDASAAPSGDASAAPSGDASVEPSGDTRAAPPGDTSAGPSGDASAAPPGDTGAAPSGDTGAAPSGDPTGGPTPKVLAASHGSPGAATAAAAATSSSPSGKLPPHESPSVPPGQGGPGGSTTGRIRSGH
ncbi:hypothetical protein [Streptomyces sp. BK205]|uniref:hypothetical protein n=1 Tax=Streptomyces sp. BK205 TaxID=2512164 RepID=UPI0010E65DAA|nr:hypothetical protein [Streptomyces sp. BK205]TCR17353.1 hypothetical protein EV578_112244 [Streptomyces sp. BK205]